MDYVQRFHEPLEATNHHSPGSTRVIPSRDTSVPGTGGRTHDFCYLPSHALWCGSHDDFTVSYAPSASIFAHCQALPPAAGRRTLILGFPDTRTPHIVDEIRAVADASPEPTVLVGSEATRRALSEMGPGCAVVHIATHGYFRRGNPVLRGPPRRLYWRASTTSIISNCRWDWSP
jgi:hypothetical protein